LPITVKVRSTFTANGSVLVESNTLVELQLMIEPRTY